jgi:hypothetical protein
VVTVAGLGETVTSTVWVDVLPSVAGEIEMDSTTVLVVGGGVCTIVSITVDAPVQLEQLCVEVAVAPPSTGTTEYVALLTRGSSR